MSRLTETITQKLFPLLSRWVYKHKDVIDMHSTKLQQFKINISRVEKIKYYRKSESFARDRNNQVYSYERTKYTRKRTSEIVREILFDLFLNQKKYFTNAIWRLKKMNLDGLTNKSLPSILICTTVVNTDKNKIKSRRRGAHIQNHRINKTIRTEVPHSKKSWLSQNEHSHRNKSHDIQNNKRITLLSNMSNLPQLHKSEDRYFVGRILTEDLEQEKRQKTVKSILNKLSQNNLRRLCSQIRSIDYPTDSSLDDLISQIFYKALEEPTFCGLYAELVRRMSTRVRRALIIKCQNEFDQSQNGLSLLEKKLTTEIELKELDESQRIFIEEENLKARRRALGNIRFIGYLYKYGLLARKTIDNCIETLLRNIEDPNPINVEVMCKLIETVGKDLENSSSTNIKGDKSAEKINLFISKVKRLRENTKLNKRLRFMCQDVLDLSDRGWQKSDKIKHEQIRGINQDTSSEIIHQTI